MNMNSENLDQPLADSERMAVAALINSVGSLMDRLVATDGLEQHEIAARMGISPNRISQVLNGDGNVRISTLACLAEACHADLSFTANFPDTKDSVIVPRMGKRTGRRPRVVSRSEEVADLGDSLSAAAMVNAIGSLMDQVVEKSGIARKDIAEAIGVTPSRVTQILDGDGNVYISTLARVMFACRATLKLEVTHRESGAVLVTPRPARRRMTKS